MTDEIFKAISWWANLLKLDADLVAAICMAESSFDPFKTRYEENWRYPTPPEQIARILGVTKITEQRLQAFSWGLMQVMGSVARELGFAGHLTQMTDINLGIQFGCIHLARKLKQFPKRIQDGVSAYNAGTPKFDPVTHLYKNQDYVNKVMGYYGQKLISNREEK